VIDDILAKSLHVSTAGWPAPGSIDTRLS